MKNSKMFIILLLITTLFLFFLKLTELPIVQWSTSQDKCVECIECSCDNLPKKYIKEWVK